MAQTPRNNRLRFSDFIRAIPSALPGLGIGFVLLFIFGLIASLTQAHPLTNLFSRIAVLCFLGCPIISYVGALRQRPVQRQRQQEEQDLSAQIDRVLTNAMAVLEAGPGSSQESMARYAEACDDMIFFCSTYFYERRYSSVVDKYRTRCYGASYPFVALCGTGYQYVIGTDVGEEIHHRIRELGEERLSGYGNR